MKSVLLCGCGNIGYRHLEAILQLDTALDLTIVEPNTAAHPRIAELLAAQTGPHHLQLLDTLPLVGRHFNLVVVATSADTRAAVIRTVLSSHSADVMILEKVLFQRLSDLDEVSGLLASNRVAAFVNCGRRYAPGYLDLLTSHAGRRPLDVTIRGNAWGLASNGIHFIDLAEFLNGASLQALDGAGLVPGSVATKRPGCVEVHGTFRGTLSNGARLSVECGETLPLAFTVTLSWANGTITIDELARQAVEQGTARPFGFKRVSEAVEIYQQALASGTCGLTPYADSARQHRLFLQMMLAHLGLPADGTCPIS